MDEFEIGPLSFKIYLDLTGKEESTAYLARPLNFSAGTWEVALEQLIFKPKNINTKHVFKVLTDFIVPQMYGTKYIQLLALDLLPSKPQIATYHYKDPSYFQVLGSYISSINIKIVDHLDNLIDIDEQFPFILKLSFQKNGVFSKR